MTNNKNLRFIFSCICLWMGMMSQAKDVFTLTFVGDVMMGTTYPDSTRNRSALPPNDGKHLFDKVMPWFGESDLTVGNLEGVLLDKGGSPKELRKSRGASSLPSYLFRMPERYVEHLVNAGFDVMTIANNHINDFGPVGVNSTVNTLNKAGIVPVGLRGRTSKAVITREGVRYGICAFGHGGNMNDLRNLEEVAILVGELREACDVLIVSFHGGAEGASAVHVPFAPETYLGEERGDVAAFAHTCVDAGADVVVGHGPHVTRAMELYKGRLIAYSLGNFCTPYRINLQGQSGYALVLQTKVDRQGRFRGGQVHSVYQTQGTGPIPDNNQRALEALRSLSSEDFPKNMLEISESGVLSEYADDFLASDPDGTLVEKVIATAKRCIGAPYRGGNSGPKAFDCSGLMKFVFKKYGIKLNSDSRSQYTQGRAVSKNELHPGDLVFFKGSARGGNIGHVGMVVEATEDNFKFIHASRRGVKIDDFRSTPYYVSRYVGAKRIIQ